jgi:hypothetical protein
MAFSNKFTATLLTVMLLILVTSSAASRTLEEDTVLNDLARAPTPVMGTTARLAAPGTWAVAAVVSLLAFLAQ